MKADTQVTYVLGAQMTLIENNSGGTICERHLFLRECLPPSIFSH